MVKIELLTSPTCPACPRAKELLRRFAKEHGYSLKELSTAGRDGQRWAKRYGVTGTPSFVIKGSVRPVLKTGVPSPGELEHMAKLANGEVEPPKGLFTRLAGLFRG